jgi:hypothetical protein
MVAQPSDTDHHLADIHLADIPPDRVAGWSA